MRAVLTAVLECVGGACLIGAGYLIAPAVALAVAGVFCLWLAYGATR